MVLVRQKECVRERKSERDEGRREGEDRERERDCGMMDKVDAEEDKRE